MFVEDPHNVTTGGDAKVELPASVLALRDALDELRNLDCAALSASELRATVVELCSAASRLEAARLDAIADLDESLAWVGVGALSAGAWLSRLTPLDAPTGRRDARVAKRLRKTPGTRAALADGTLSPGTRAALADGASADPVAFEQIEDAIVEAAKTSDRSKVKQALKLWDELVRGEDRVGAVSNVNASRCLRCAHCTYSRGGSGGSVAETQVVGGGEARRPNTRSEASMFGRASPTGPATVGRCAGTATTICCEQVPAPKPAARTARS